MAAIFITGLPGSGKTTCIRKIAACLDERQLGGFYTRELREGSARVGFELVGFDGRRQILAHRGIPGRYKVGKYGVDVVGFEDFLSSFTTLSGKDCVIIIDEIGKMECYSVVFRDTIIRILKDDCLLVATIAKKGDTFIEGIKKRNGIVLLELKQENRDVLHLTVLDLIRSQEKTSAVI